jgi:hypothetical protein
MKICRKYRIENACQEQQQQQQQQQNEREEGKDDTQNETE